MLQYTVIDVVASTLASYCGKVQVVECRLNVLFQEVQVLRPDTTS